MTTAPDHPKTQLVGQSVIECVEVMLYMTFAWVVTCNLS